MDKDWSIDQEVDDQRQRHVGFGQRFVVFRDSPLIQEQTRQVTVVLVKYG